MARLSLFTHEFLLLLAGPLVWAIHFLVIYGFSGIACARPPVSADLVTWVVAAAGLLAIALLAAIFLRAQSRAPDAQDRQLVRQVGLGLALLSALAIAWETLPVFLAPPCS